jgi:hypothetical protein
MRRNCLLPDRSPINPTPRQKIGVILSQLYAINRGHPDFYIKTANIMGELSQYADYVDKGYPYSAEEIALYYECRLHQIWNEI